MIDFVAFDLETTGIQADVDAIVEVGAVRFENGSPKEPFNALVNPGRPIPKEAFDVHGISDADVAGKPPIQEVMVDLTAYCGDLPMVAHNARFDFKFLEVAVNTHRCKAPSGMLLDTFALAKKVINGVPNYRLETLTKHFGFPSTVFHRASEDAEYCGKLLVEILRILEKNQMSSSPQSLLTLMEMKEMHLPQIAPQAEQLGLF